MSSLAQSLVFALLVFLQPAYANYYIDDTNSTLDYSSGPNASWGPFAAGGKYYLELLLPNGTYMDVDPYPCYNHTYRYARCYSEDNCILTIPFMGSGITIYVYQSGPVGINASFAIDGSLAQIQVLLAPPAPNYAIPNVSMFDVQQLRSGPHTASLTVNDLFGSYSSMIWDYAYVNETLVTNPPPQMTPSIAITSLSDPPSSTSLISSPTLTTGVPPTSTTLSALPSYWDSGRIIGSVVGGIVGIIVIGVIATLFLLRKKLQKKVDLTEEPDLRSFNPLDNPSHPGVSAHSPDTGRKMPSPFVPNGHHASVEQVSRPNVIAPFPDGRPAPSAILPRSNVSHSFTDERAEVAVGRVMERMLADRHAGIREWRRGIGLSRTNSFATTPPLSNDLQDFP